MFFTRYVRCIFCSDTAPIIRRCCRGCRYMSNLVEGVRSGALRNEGGEKKHVMPYLGWEHG